MPGTTPVLPISFAVFHDDEPADATLDFADNADVISTTRWRVPNLDGIQLLQAVCMIGRTLGCQRVWGEATRDSAPFYRRYLRQPVDDQFTIGSGEIATFAAQLEAERKS